LERRDNPGISERLVDNAESVGVQFMSTASETSAIVIRDVETFAELRAVEELQKEIWGVPDIDVVPLTHLIAAKAAGGVLLGAFDRKTLVGFVYGFVAQEDGEIAHHSHMLAVKHAYRNFNLGYKLKLAQRDAVLAQGINLITWTFDPLQSLNAYFNFAKLGVISDRYLINFYGEEAASFLHQSGTDRFWVKWLLNSERVVQRLNKTNPPLEDPSDKLLIEIPGDINAVQQQSPELARECRERTRRAFTEAIEASYVVLDFYRETRKDEKVGIYILGK
jgi:predicted GNAT superfamily acetyltransferase